MSEHNQRHDRAEGSRRSVLKAGALASVASVIGLSGTAAADQTETPQEGQGGQEAWMFNDEFRPGAIFRVSSPRLEGAPDLQEESGRLENAGKRIIEYFNTKEEAYLFLPEGTRVEQGTLYRLHENYMPTKGVAGDTEGIVQVGLRKLDDQNFPFDLEDEDIDVLDEGGGEGAVRPRNFTAGGLFRITSEPENWVPPDVAESGFFTDYDTRHAQYLWTDEEFLFFPQEDASVETGAVYVMEGEFELLDPQGNLIAAEFDRVDEGSLPFDEPP